MSAECQPNDLDTSVAVAVALLQRAETCSDAEHTADQHVKTLERYMSEMRITRNLAAAIGRLQWALDDVPPDSRHATKLQLAIRLIEEVERTHETELDAPRW